MKAAALLTLRVASAKDCFEGSSAFSDEKCCHLFHGEEGNIGCWDGAEYTYSNCCMVDGYTVEQPLIHWDKSEGFYVNATSSMQWYAKGNSVSDDSHWLLPMCNAVSFALKDLLDVSFCLAAFAGATYPAELHEWVQLLTRISNRNARMACENMKKLGPDLMPAHLQRSLAHFLRKMRHAVKRIPTAPASVTNPLEGPTLLDVAGEIQSNFSNSVQGLALQLRDLPWQQDGTYLLRPLQAAWRVRKMLRRVSEELVFRMHASAWFEDGRLGTGKVSLAKFHLGMGTVRWQILSQLVSSLPPGDVRMVEIGVRTAPTPAFLLAEHPNLHWTGIDADPEAQQSVEAKLSEFIQKGRADFRLGFSHQVAVEGLLDLVFIDGDHLEDAVLLDLDTWSPRVRSGGIMAGHDYGVHVLGVIKAVNSWLPEGKTLHLSLDHVWWFYVD